MGTRIRTLLLTAVCSLGAAAPAAPGAAAAEPFTASHDLSYDLGSPPSSPALNQLDIYSPLGAGAAAPTVVYVHGGTWRSGDKGNKITDKARLFTARGYVFVSVNYRLSPDPPDTSDPTRIRFPAHPHDIGEAIGWLGENVGDYDGDPSRLILIGHSAGAHLVSLVATQPAFLRAYGTAPRDVRGVVALDTAAFDLVERANPATSTLGTNGLTGLWNAFATGSENASDGSWRAASPLHQANREDAPHRFVTQAPNPKRIEQNSRMAEALGHDAADAVLTVDLDHAGIKDALGKPGDDSGETEAVLEFVAAALAADSAPKPRLTGKPGKLLRTHRGKRRARARFRFTATDERARFDCRIDKRRWRHCNSPKSYRLGRGKHRFETRARNRDGKSDVRTYKFRVRRR